MRPCDLHEPGERAPLVLVVEDDAAIREAVCELLRDDGYTVAEAHDGREAMGQLAAGLSPDVVLLDLMMPILNGWELLAWMDGQPRLLALPILVVSASTVGIAPPAAAHGGPAARSRRIAYLRKPVRSERLLDAVRRACAPVPKPALA